ncbi:hypothetical protein Salat_1162100 [Sesamum alatum]|uniref:Uncharacterized protein n=1 Tax=Sesamum alatum TaxID=300844 RepID=A0AAE1YFI5_9LAMI|nr:hypothetical protein Salat_1162100 [Sesamum alatum]
MQARIANRLRSKKGTLPLSIAPQTDSSQPEASSLLSAGGLSLGNLVYSSAPNDPALTISPSPIAEQAPPFAIGIASGDIEAKSKGKEVVEGPSEPKKHKRRHHKSSRSNKSSKRSKSRSEKRKAKQAAEKAKEVENLKLVQELTEWWKGACEELRTPKCVSAEMEGEKLVPH